MIQICRFKEIEIIRKMEKPEKEIVCVHFQSFPASEVKTFQNTRYQSDYTNTEVKHIHRRHNKQIHSYRKQLNL